MEFLAFGGDLTERPTDAYWAETFRALDSLCTTLPCLVVTGNHDCLKYLKRKCERRFALFSVKRPSNNRVQRLVFNGLIQDAGFRLVLQGHEHAYARCTVSEEPVTAPTISGQTTYLVSHCSPKGYRIHPTPRFYPVIRDTRTYQIIRVAPSAVTLHTYDATTGLPLDSVTLKP